MSVEENLEYFNDRWHETLQENAMIQRCLRETVEVTDLDPRLSRTILVSIDSVCLTASPLNTGRGLVHTRASQIYYGRGQTGCCPAICDGRIFPVAGGTPRLSTMYW